MFEKLGLQNIKLENKLQDNFCQTDYKQGQVYVKISDRKNGTTLWTAGRPIRGNLMTLFKGIVQ